tara:strand:+ start:2066 stop:2257 length:192 start_codon:yes stop_codon:yes gene_type:complete
MNRKHAYFSWESEAYSEFMLDVMLSLEPYRQESNVTLYNELEEVHQVTFFINGSFEIGFEVNS